MDQVLNWLVWFWHWAPIKGAMSGAASAAFMDVQTFRKWRNWSDLKSYDWGLASFNWVKGAFFGALTSLGLGAIGM